MLVALLKREIIGQVHHVVPKIEFSTNRKIQFLLLG